MRIVRQSYPMDSNGPHLLGKHLLSLNDPQLKSSYWAGVSPVKGTTSQDKVEAICNGYVLTVMSSEIFPCQLGMPAPRLQFSQLHPSPLVPRPRLAPTPNPAWPAGMFFKPSRVRCLRPPGKRTLGAPARCPGSV